MGCKVKVLLYSDFQEDYEELINNEGGVTSITHNLLDPEETTKYFK